MPIYEIEAAGQFFEVDAPDEKSAIDAVAIEIGQQSAASMVPSPIDFGPKPAQRENVFGDITQEAMKQPLEALQYYGQRITEPDRNLAQRAGDVGMAGLMGLGTAYAGGAGALAEIFAGDPTQERKLARDLMMAGEVAVPELTGVTSSASRLGRKVSAGKLPISSREYGEMTPRMEAARAAQEISITPSAGMQGRLPSMLEAGLEASPFSAGQVQRGRERVISEMQEVSQQSASDLGIPTTIEKAGEKIKAGSADFVKQFKQKSTALYNDLDRYIRPNDLVVAPSTSDALETILQYSDEHPEISKMVNLQKYQPFLKGFRQDGIDTAIPYELIKDLRTTFGESLSTNSGPLGDLSQAKIKQIYGALTDDMEQAAISSGPEAHRAWRRANQYYKAGRNFIDETLAKVLNVDTETAAYNKLHNMLIEGNARQSTKDILTIKRRLPEDAFNDFRATVVNRMGLAKKGGQDDLGEVFSPQTFLTNYNKMADTSRKIVFGKTAPELNKLAKTINSFKEAGLDTNFSKTAPTLTTQGIISAFATGALGLGTTVAIVAANKGSAAFLTNVKVLKALNAAARNDISLLQKIAQGSDLIAAEAQTILRTSAAMQANQQ